MLSFYKGEDFVNNDVVNKKRIRKFSILVAIMSTVIAMLIVCIVGCSFYDPFISKSSFFNKISQKFSDVKSELVSDETTDEQAIDTSLYESNNRISEETSNINQYANEDVNQSTNDNLDTYVTGNNQDVKSKIKDLCTQDSRLVSVLQNFDSYPLILMKGLARNPETTEYVLNYNNSINKNYNDSIDTSVGVEIINNNVPLFLQWDSRWGYASYCGGTIGTHGCGVTCLSMVYAVLKGDYSYNPLKMANFSERNGYAVYDVGTSWDLMTSGATELGLSSRSIEKGMQNMINSLNQGKYIIASMGPGIFTGGGHFIVFTGYSNGMFSVNDPFSKALSNRKYSYNEIKSQIKALWAIGR